MVWQSVDRGQHGRSMRLWSKDASVAQFFEGDEAFSCYGAVRVRRQSGTVLMVSRRGASPRNLGDFDFEIFGTGTEVGAHPRS